MESRRACRCSTPHEIFVAGYDSLRFLAGNGCRERRICGAIGQLIAVQRYSERVRKQRGTMSAWQDFHRDWHRWSTAERVSAALLGILVTIGLPAAVLFNLHPI